MDWQESLPTHARLAALEAAIAVLAVRTGALREVIAVIEAQAARVEVDGLYAGASDEQIEQAERLTSGATAPFLAILRRLL